MAIMGRERLQPSLLDRLTDHAPDQRRESLEQQTLSMRQLREAVLRDLAWLLNTTNLAATEDLAATPRVAASTLNYGVPGFAGLVSAARKIASLEGAIADAIRAYEPRIRPDTLRVRAREPDDTAAVPTLIFEIQGELWAQPVPQHLFLETAIDIETRLAVITDTPPRAAGALRKGRRSFLKKRTKKLLLMVPGLYRRPGQTNKNFLLLFFKKEVLSFLLIPMAR